MIDSYFEIVAIGTALRFTIMDHDNQILNAMWNQLNKYVKGKKFESYYKKLIGCPFCNGFWFGLLIYSIYDFYQFNLINGFLAGISVGLISYLFKDVLLFFYLKNELMKRELGLDDDEYDDSETNNEDFISYGLEYDTTETNSESDRIEVNV